MSDATKARKFGAPAVALGEANTRLELCEARVADRVPDEVTGLPLTVKIAGSERPTDVTVPPPPPATAAQTPSPRRNVLDDAVPVMLRDAIASLSVTSDARLTNDGDQAVPLHRGKCPTDAEDCVMSPRGWVCDVEANEELD